MIILALGTIMAFGAVLGANGGTEEEICGHLGTAGTGDVVWWSSTVVHGETLTAMGAYSAFLDKATGPAGSTHAQFTLATGITLEQFQDAIDGATSKWSFWYWLESIGVTNGPQFELLFEDPTAGSQGWVEITAVGLQGTTGGAVWAEEILDSDTPAGYGGWGEAGIGASFFNWGSLTALSGIEAAINGEANVTNASDWELTRVRVQLWEAIDQYCYTDDITIEGDRYDLEPCGIVLEPDIAKNVKTADETFIVVDGDGFGIDGLTCVWLVTKGEGTGEVTKVAGGTGFNFITVRMVTVGDCIITCDVTSEDYEVALHAEKKWGEIYYTELTAWEPTPCLDPDTAHPRSGIEVDEKVLVQEKVFATFLPGPVPAPAGGAKITWWLLENDAEDEAQTALEELLERFGVGNYTYETGPLGWGHGCGQYGDWAGDPTFIPEDLINAIYATHAASDTNFVEEECAAVGPTTKTVTYTDHAGDPLGEGFTNTTVEFSEVVSTSQVEPVIVVVLADYPLDKNGENAVCVEYFKFSPKAEHKDVQTYLEYIDAIRTMLYVFVRDYDESPAINESVEFDIDGPYGLFEALLAKTDHKSTVCYPDTKYPAGIFMAGKRAVSTTRAVTAAEKTKFTGLVTGTGSGDALYFGATGYAIAGVKIVSSFKKCVDILIRVHDCLGEVEVIITRDVMVCFGAPDMAVNTYDDGAGWYAMSVPLVPADDTPEAVYDELGAGVEIYDAWPYDPPYEAADAVHEERGAWVYLSGTTTITVEGAEVVADTDFLFPTAGWYMISAPYTADWAEADFHGDPTDFQNDFGDVFVWSIGVNGVYVPHFSDISYVLDPWKGYWLLVLNAGAELTLSKTLAPAPGALGITPMGRSVEGLARPPAPPTALEGAGISVELAMSSSGVSFVASGPVTSLKAKVFALDGGLVAEQTADGNELVWSMQSAAGEPVANGVYLVNVSAMNQAGYWIDLGLFRVLVLR